VVLLVRGGQQQAVLGRWGRETVVMEDEGWEILKFWGRRVFRNKDVVTWDEGLTLVPHIFLVWVITDIEG